jgi:glyoxylase-like metal-dependent hydrolase (beta-lactamase superfamily II)
MNLDILPIGLYGENSYVLHDKDHVLFIDPGRYAEKIASCVDKNETVDAIVLTHGHEDHTGAVDDLVDKYHCPVYMSAKDVPLVDPKCATDRGYSAPVYAKILPLSEKLQAGQFKLTVYETPGHTAGSVCIQYRNLLFTGDTLFAGDIGRTDLYSGSPKDMMQSMQVFKALPHDLQIYPGHGPASSISQELKSNLYLQHGTIEY